jgi:hypothetical protein
MIDPSPLHACRPIARGILKGTVGGKARRYLALLLMAICVPGPGFGQQQEPFKMNPQSSKLPLKIERQQPELKINRIGPPTCSELKSRLATNAAEDKSLCTGTAYTQRPKACIAIAQQLVATAQEQLSRLSECPELDAKYAGAIIAYAARNARLFEIYVEELDKREASRSQGGIPQAVPRQSAPRRCWVVSQQCQDCNVNGCFPYVCNSRTECE